MLTAGFQLGFQQIGIPTNWDSNTHSRIASSADVRIDPRRVQMAVALGVVALGVRMALEAHISEDREAPAPMEGPPHVCTAGFEQSFPTKALDFRLNFEASGV